ncbi:LysR family transcriptional regulator [Paraburkholderia strydomiana]|uniref:LysR family transcriptional regulator n=1 Tax=Paraburkholderia strydomiana TaxID=1245417 RepID=UPI001BE5B46A|nr:LysR family transcriptional regulator [Paraburkholderia strydomiana]MBT2792810.1 LysR family transcriptional regulator [Paraburkholderia strydomiana]
MDRIEVMRLFIRVADSGNFSKVARVTGISQPTVSKVIAGLEAKLGVQLLRRTSRGLNLTDAGQDFYESATAIVESVDDVEARIGKNEAAPSGMVRVALSPAFGRMEIVPYLPEFFSRYPDVSVEFDVSQRYVNLIEEGLDVAIRVGPLSDSALVARRIGSMKYLTTAAPSYLERAGVPRTLDDLKKHDCIAFMSRDAPRPWEFLGPAGPVEFIPQGPVRSNDAEYLRAAVLAGLGIGHNAGWLYSRDVDAGHLVPLLHDFAPPAFPIHAVWSGSRRLSGKTRVFIDFLVELFAANPLLNV